MKALYKHEELEKAKSYDLLPCECIKCSKIFYKQKRIILRYPSKGYCSPKCQGVDSKKIKVFTTGNCEYCNKYHDGSYGSGKFCSSFCSHGFSTEKKRKEINEKVRIKNSNNTTSKIERSCIICKNIFLGIYKTCSAKCGHVLAGRTMKGTVRKKDGYKNNGGLRVGGGRSKVFEYNSPIAGLIKINNQEIRVAKILDQLKLKWKRNTTGFLYQTLDGLTRKYYPDFYLEDFDVYVEFKGWVTDEMTHKMNDAINNNNIKLIIIYSDSKRYSKLGLNIQMIEEDSKKLLNELT